MRGSPSSCLGQIQILAGNDWTEVVTPMEELGEKSKEVKGIVTP